MDPLSRRILFALAASLATIVVLAVLGQVPLSYNLRNLAVRWRTTLMTGLAFTLVVALLVVMLAFVNGMYALTKSSGQPNNVIVLSQGATDEQFSNLGFGDSTEIALNPYVHRNDSGKPLASSETYLVVNQPIPNPNNTGPKRRFVQLRGIDDPLIAGEVHGVTLQDGGQWFSEAGVQASKENPGGQAIQAVIGPGVAQVMAKDRGKPSMLVGDEFETGGKQWVIVGIFDSAASTFGSEIWAKRSLIGPIFGKETITSIVCQAKDPKSAKKLRDDLVANYKKSSVEPQLETDYFAKLSETNVQFLVAILFVTVFMSIGGVFGVMNTMFAAISQRTKDIGVMRMLGYGRWQILISFLFESMVLAFIGGLIGCALGSLVHGTSASSVVSGGQGGGKSVVLKITVTVMTLAIGLGVSLAMGFLGGLIPSISAMRLKPLEAIQGARR